MSSFLFLDPNHHHQQAPIDPHIEFIQTPNDLDQSLANNNELQRVVCICGDNKSPTIQAIQGNPQVVSIYPCKDHGEPEADPLFDFKVQDETDFTSNNGWVFKGRLALLRNCIKHRCDDQVSSELEKLKRIEKQSLSTSWPAVEVVEPQQDISSDVCSKSEETK
jgi:hypothetical protein